MSFKLEDFIAAPSQELLNLAKKSDLLEIASHYSIPSVKTSMLKREIKNTAVLSFSSLLMRKFLIPQLHLIL